MELMGTTMFLCRSYGIEFLSLDIDEAIMIINYFIETANEKEQANTKKEQRIKVNDKTATGGWF